MRKFQCFAKSSSSTIVTSRMFLQPHIPEGVGEYNFPVENVEVDYIDQNIPSAYGMPAYESVVKLEPKIFRASHKLMVKMEVDLSGMCVKVYA
eukprot:13608376-Ditylum_brightwellii.AAC.1